MAQELDVVAPCCGVAVTHLHDVGDHFEDSGVGVGPDIVEQIEGVDVQGCLCGELTQKKMKCWDWAGLAQLEKTSQNFVMEYDQWFSVRWSDWKC